MTQRWTAPADGELTAGAHGLWLTRSGDLDDHLLQPGERLPLAAGDDLVLQALRPQAPALWEWAPASQPAVWPVRLRRAWALAARACRGRT